jgi:hypothetical protein
VDGDIGEDDYQALTDREEKDLERLLLQFNNVLSNAENCMEQFAKDLSLLDGVPTHLVLVCKIFIFLKF